MQWISFATASVNITIAAMFFGGWVMTKHRMLLGYALSYAFYTVGFACFAIQHLNPLIVHFGNGALIVGTMVLAYALAQRSRWQLDGFSCLIISGLGVSAILLGVSLGSPQVGYVGVYGSLGLTTLMAARAGHGARPGDILEKTVVWTLYAVAAIMLSNPRFLNGFMPDMVPFEFAEGSWAFYATVWIIMSQLLAGSLIALAMRDVIQRAQKEAVIDPLSGLLNRRGFNAALNRDHRKGDRAALVMVDIDHFKAINDQLGHDVGD
ncbi:MAG: GGDEF domain-containing protein, partial [Pseudomonadota bacterium]